MVKAILWVSAAAVAGLASYWFTLYAAPHVIMDRTMAQFIERGGQENVLVHPPRVDETSRRVVRPSPDLAYSVTVFDLSDGPVRFTAPKTETYMSLSFFAANTDNFFAVNDRELGPRGLDVVLVRERNSAGGFAAKPADAGATIVQSPTDRGIALFRRVIPSDGAWPEIDRQRREARVSAD